MRTYVAVAVGETPQSARNLFVSSDADVAELVTRALLCKVQGEPLPELSPAPQSAALAARD